MRKDTTARRSSAFHDLFAERQVYLRDGLTSRYLVLSRSLQIVATLGALVIVAGLGFASYSSVAKHRAAEEQSRQVARLEDLNQSLRVAAEAAPKPAQVEALAARVPELEKALAEAGAAREQAQTLARTSGAEATDLRRELTLARQRIGELEAAREMAAATGAPEDADGAASELSEELARRETRIARLSEDLDQARAERDRLAARLDDAQGASEQTIAQLTQQVESAAQEARQVRGDLATRTGEVERLQSERTAADAEVERLRGDLEAALADATALRTAAQSAETALAELQAGTARSDEETAAADLAELKRSAEAAVAQAAGLKATLASAEARIATLSADLERAKSELAAVRQLPASAPAVGERAAPDAAAPDLRARLEAADQRIAELESALKLSLANLAPLPPPPAPR